MKVLSIDFDAFLECPKELLELFPRVTDRRVHKDVKRCREMWEEAIRNNPILKSVEINMKLVDKIIVSLNTSINRHRNSPPPNVRFIHSHEEILLAIKQSISIDDDFISIVNFDQHHDHYGMHSTELDCSNWAMPEQVSKAFPEITKYTYCWGKTDLSSDDGNCMLNGRQYGSMECTSISDRADIWSDTIKHKSFDLIVMCGSAPYVPPYLWEDLSYYVYQRIERVASRYGRG